MGWMGGGADSGFVITTMTKDEMIIKYVKVDLSILKEVRIKKRWHPTRTMK